MFRHVCLLVYDQRARACSVRTLFERRSPEEAGSWQALPDWVDYLPEIIGLDGEEVLEWKHLACSGRRQP